jgi:hypothetical protein
VNHEIIALLGVCASQRLEVTILGIYPLDLPVILVTARTKYSTPTTAGARHYMYISLYGIIPTPRLTAQRVDFFARFDIAKKR